MAQRLLSATLVFALLAGANAALAQAADAPSPGATQADQADTLFNEARRLMDEGKYERACPLLAQSNALDPQAGTALNLAYCYENVGRSATAYWLYTESAIDAEQHNQADRAAFARYRAHQLEPHLSRVRIFVSPQPARDRIEVRVAERLFVPAEWGVPIPLDPGEYELRARAEGHQPWSHRFVVDEAHQPSIVVPTLEREAPASRPPSGRDAPSIVVPLAWTLAGFGAAALATGAGFGFAAIAHDDVANENGNCIRDVCNARGSSERSNAHLDAEVADLSFATSAVALLTAGALAITRLQAPLCPPAVLHGWTLAPEIARNDWGLSVARTW